MQRSPTVTGSRRSVNGAPARSAPSKTLLALESRAVLEFGAFVAMTPFLSALPRGDGHPVLVIPPFLSTDSATRPLRWFLTSLGYQTHGWGLGPNLWRTEALLESTPEVLRDLAGRYAEPVSIVGWSAGGLWARELGRTWPALVRQVVTLGTPFRHRPHDASNVDHLIELVEHLQVPLPRSMACPESERPPLPVPTTSIYTRTDGIASWVACLEAPGSCRENIEVLGSHSGLGHNPSVLLAVADRLGLAPGAWRPFEAPPGLACFYPTPAAWDPSLDPAPAT